jgi:hypothetical protein
MQRLVHHPLKKIPTGIFNTQSKCRFSASLYWTRSIQTATQRQLMIPLAGMKRNGDCVPHRRN